MHTKIAIDAKDPDIAETMLEFWDGDSVFLKQIETGGKPAGTLLFHRDSVPALIDALNRFLNPTPDYSHGFHIFKDGNMWCAVGPHFRNIQEDRAGFGETPLIAYTAWWAANEHSPNIRAVVHSEPGLDAFTVHQ